ncbi:hypothetical protein CPAR01_13801 [Colletotrichum paranaense]|uniref:Uncharacterized protein n=2 Tax=Colletotrichum acutatum species complex TaxID=2707335 RepID=A0AAI9UZ20_9PEZI|nr:uncharacterized protein CPAR01_13801 [Colletotrichum paranaense]KAK1467482.1 hypothetical protein CMEL01_11475 [Colletotrichum melonis]KAK1524853.1 hypothetical protein CPAR01_13801 [Colletotrichum paranaense]
MAFRSVLHDSIPSTAPFDTDPSFQATNGPLHWAAYTWWRNPPTDNCFPQRRLFLCYPLSLTLVQEEKKKTSTPKTSLHLVILGSGPARRLGGMRLCCTCGGPTSWISFSGPLKPQRTSVSQQTSGLWYSY